MSNTLMAGLNEFCAEIERQKKQQARQLGRSQARAYYAGVIQNASALSDFCVLVDTCASFAKCDKTYCTSHRHRIRVAFSMK